MNRDAAFVAVVLAALALFFCFAGRRPPEPRRPVVVPVRVDPHRRW